MIAAHWAPVAEVLGGTWPGLHPARVPRAGGVMSLLRAGLVWGLGLCDI